MGLFANTDERDGRFCDRTDKKSEKTSRPEGPSVRGLAFFDDDCHCASQFLVPLLQYLGLAVERRCAAAAYVQDRQPPNLAGPVVQLLRPSTRRPGELQGTTTWDRNPRARLVRGAFPELHTSGVSEPGTSATGRASAVADQHFRLDDVRLIHERTSNSILGA